MEFSVSALDLQCKASKTHDEEIWRVVVDLAGIDQEKGKSEVGKGTALSPLGEDI